MKAFEASASIDAPASAVWAALTDADRFTEWDSGVVRVEGRIAPGEQIKVVSKINPNRTFPVKVTTFEPARLMRWTGGMPMGLFKGERTFTLESQGERSTRFHMREEFSGPLLPLIGRSIPDLGPTFQQFARDLKARAEASA